MMETENTGIGDTDVGAESEEAFDFPYNCPYNEGVGCEHQADVECLRCGWHPYRAELRKAKMWSKLSPGLGAEADAVEVGRAGKLGTAPYNILFTTPYSEHLYRLGLTDAQLAEVWNTRYPASRISPTRVQAWRKAKGYASNSCRRLDVERAMELYLKGMSDEDIGFEMGCSTGTVLAWRKKSALPGKYERALPRNEKRNLYR